MKQEQFVARYQAEWTAFELWLNRHGSVGDTVVGVAIPYSPAPGALPSIHAQEMPQRYRRLCQQLALARRRGYSYQVTERLQQLAQRGHNQLYRPPAIRWARAVEFVLADFPALVRQQARCMWAATALFGVPLIGIFILLQYYPNLGEFFLSPETMAQMEEMYNPEAKHTNENRASDSNIKAFGYYIWNNTSIGLKTFASGLVFGIGSIFILIFNGISIGSTLGHLQSVGHGEPLWRFIAGHGSFELTAIVICGGAGLRLGFNLIAPGRQRRVDALKQGGIVGAKLCLGAALMFFIAAFIEAFWSSNQGLPGWVMFSVATVLWLTVFVWLGLGGRDRGNANAH